MHVWGCDGPRMAAVLRQRRPHRYACAGWCGVSSQGRCSSWFTHSDQRCSAETARQRLALAQGWHHSALTGVRIIAAAPGKVECLAHIDRYRADGTRYQRVAVLSIVTKVAEQWGI